MIWALNQMPYSIDDARFDSNTIFLLSDLMIIIYYSGAIVGAFIGAALVGTFRKNSVYVSELFY